MRAEETDEALAAALRAAGVALSPSQLHGLVGDGADALAAWRAFSALAREPVEDVGRWADDDLMIYESGAGEFHPGRYHNDPAHQAVPIYELTFRRQFGFSDADGEYAGMAALGLSLDFERTPALLATADEQLWGYGGPNSAATPPGEAASLDLDGWVAAVEASPAFTIGFGGADGARRFRFSYFRY